MKNSSILLAKHFDSNTLAQHEREMENLRDLCPYGTNFSYKFVEARDSYSVSIKVQFAGECFQQTSQSKNFIEAEKLCLDGIYSQIRLWRQTRFQSHEQISDIQMNEAKKAPCVLIVDDDPIVTKKISRILRKIGCKTKTVDNGIDGVNEITKGKYDLVVLDWFLDEMDGGDVLIKSYLKNTSGSDEVRASWASFALPVVIYSGHITSSTKIFVHTHFRILDRWDKSLETNQLIKKTQNILCQIDTAISVARAGPM